MLQNLLLTNLFLIANSLITISFILFAFLYLDLYFQSKKTYALYVGFGGVLIAFSFLSSLVFEIYEVGAFREYIVLILQFLGLLTVASGFAREVVPVLEGKSKVKATQKLSVTVLPLFASFLFFVNFLLAGFITAKNMHKVHYGKSVEFKPLLYFWWIMTFVFFLNLMSFLSNDRFPMLEIALSKYSFVWSALQVFLLVAFVMMYKWIRLFLSFRNFTKILFDIWSFSIVLCLLVSSLFLSINTSSYEKEIIGVLQNNGGMVEFNLEQIKKSNADVLSSVISSDDIVKAFSKADTSSLERQVRFLSVENSTLDQIMFVDFNGRIIYNSESVDTVGNILGDNLLVNSVLEGKESQGDFFIQRSGTIVQRLVYQTIFPVFENNQFLGVVVGAKNLDFSFLTLLNNFTNQEVLLLDQEGVVLSSVLKNDEILLDDTVRMSNIRELDESGSIIMEINNSSYLGSVVEIEDRFGKKIADFIVLSSYQIVASTAQNSMYITAFYALILSLLAFVPSYFLAKKIEKESV